MNEYGSTYESSYITFNEYLTKVFSTMVVGLLISTLSAFFGQGLLFTSYGYTLMMASTFACLGIAFFFSFRIRQMSVSAAWTCYIMYSLLLGLSLSSIFLVYDLGSIVWAFGATTILFGCMAIIGHTTKMDLSRFSTILLAGLIAIIISSLLNIFIKSAALNRTTLILGVVIFLGLIAYDMQMLRRYYEEGYTNPSMQSKIMIYGAFQLYLDFVNLFLRILQFFGKRRD